MAKKNEGADTPTSDPAIKKAPQKKMVTAECTKPGYNSTRGVMYKQGSRYTVDINDPWVASHFKQVKATEDLEPDLEPDENPDE